MILKARAANGSLSSAGRSDLVAVDAALDQLHAGDGGTSSGLGR